MGNDSLANYYKTNFALMQHHKYDIDSLENMIPFERDLYVMLLAQHIEEENDKIQQQNNARKGR
jgi:hypothetical protein